MEKADIVAGVRHYIKQMRKLTREGKLTFEERSQFAFQYSMRPKSPYASGFKIQNIIDEFERGRMSYFCSCCGEPASTSYHGNERMIEEKLCFGCNLWDLRSQKPGIFIETKEGIEMFSLAKRTNPSDSTHNGYGGALRRIIHDGKTTITNNLWHGGAVSYFWIDKFKPNASFGPNPTMAEYCDEYFAGKKESLISQVVNRLPIARDEAAFHLGNELWDVSRVVRKYYTPNPTHPVNLLKEFVRDESAQ